MTWIYTDFTKVSTTDSNAMALSGHEVWVTSQDKVKVINYLSGSNVATIDLSSYTKDTNHIIKAKDHMFVTNTAAKFRYYRLNVTSSDDGVDSSLGYFQLREKVGGSNVLTNPAWITSTLNGDGSTLISNHATGELATAKQEYTILLILEMVIVKKYKNL